MHCSTVTAAALCTPIIEWAPHAGLLSHAHPVSIHALPQARDCKSQRAKEKAVVFCETLTVFPMSSLSALAGRKRF